MPESEIPDMPPPWDRFARWPRQWSRLALAGLVILLLASALVPITAAQQRVTPAGLGQVIGSAPQTQRPRDDDLAVYDRAIERIRGGENYYSFIVAEHRAAHFPVRPGLAVRQPTLAYLQAWLGDGGQTAAAFALCLGVMLAWWKRLGSEPGGAERRPLAMALLLFGVSLGLNRYFFTLHELWSGMLLALSFALYRPASSPGAGDGRWSAALAAAALALAIREHALPFVLLMGAVALWQRDWRQALAWGGLALAFGAGLAWHLHLIGQQTGPGDQVSASWLALRGLTGWLSDIVLSSNLRYLPHWLAGPLVVMMVFGWAGWRSAAGTFAALLYAGYGLAFAIVGRADNYYWGAMVAPAMFIGLAFVPMAVRSLWRSAAAP
jgi:hypothetical protein